MCSSDLNGGTLSITGGVTTVAGLMSSALVTAQAGLTVSGGNFTVSSGTGTVSGNFNAARFGTNSIPADVLTYFTGPTSALYQLVIGNTETSGDYIALTAAAGLGLTFQDYNNAGFVMGRLSTTGLLSLVGGLSITGGSISAPGITATVGALWATSIGASEALRVEGTTLPSSPAGVRVQII